VQLQVFLAEFCTVFALHGRLDAVEVEDGGHGGVIAVA